MRGTILRLDGDGVDVILLSSPPFLLAASATFSMSCVSDVLEISDSSAEDCAVCLLNAGRVDGCDDCDDCDDGEIRESAGVRDDESSGEDARLDEESFGDA